MEQALPSFELNMDPREFSRGMDVSKITAEEYLAWVRYEAEHAPGVVRVDVDAATSNQTKYMPHVEEIAACPDSYLPDESWENSTLESFSNLRLALERRAKDISSRERRLVVPAMKDQSSWYTFCLGTKWPMGNDAVSEGVTDAVAGFGAAQKDGHVSPDLEDRKAILLHEYSVCRDDTDQRGMEGPDDNPELEVVENDGPSNAIEYAADVSPSMVLMLQFDQVLTQRLLSYLASWLSQGFGSVREQQVFCGGAGGLDVLTSEVMERWEWLAKQCKWIYSLLCRLEKPLYRDAAADVRGIYRSCCLERTHLAQHFNTYYPAKTDKSYVSDKEMQRSSAQKEVRFAEECDKSPVSSKDRCTAIDDADCPNHVAARASEHLAVLNTIILVTGKYFGQGESMTEECCNEQCDIVTLAEDVPFDSAAGADGYCEDDYRLDDDGRGDY